MTNKPEANLIPFAIIGVIIIIAAAVVIPKSSFFKEKNTLNAQEVGEKVIDFIDKNILQGQATASLINVVEDNDLYKLTFTINNQEFTSYATLNGSLLFPEAIDLNVQPPPLQQLPPESLPQDIPEQEPSPQDVPGTDNPDEE